MEKISTGYCASEKGEDYADNQTGPEKLAAELTIKSLQPFLCDPSLAHTSQAITHGGWESQRVHLGTL